MRQQAPQQVRVSGGGSSRAAVVMAAAQLGGVLCCVVGLSKNGADGRWRLPVLRSEAERMPASGRLGDSRAMVRWARRNPHAQLRKPCMAIAQSSPTPLAAVQFVWPPCACKAELELPAAALAGRHVNTQMTSPRLPMGFSDACIAAGGGPRRVSDGSMSTRPPSDVQVMPPLALSPCTHPMKRYPPMYSYSTLRSASPAFPLRCQSGSRRTVPLRVLLLCPCHVSLAVTQLPAN